MSQQDKQEAAEKVGRAARQARHAANNLGGAAEAAAEHLGEEAAEKASVVHDALNRTMSYKKAGLGAVLILLGVYQIGRGVGAIKTASKFAKNSDVV